MELITEQKRAKGVAEAWREAYRNYPDSDGSKRKITETLAALKNPTPKRIKDIIGHDSWTAIACDSCGESVKRAVLCADRGDDFESIVLCQPCIEAALDLIAPNQIRT